MSNVDKVSVLGKLYNLLSPTVIGSYVETIGEGCADPSGYTSKQWFLAYYDDVQYCYKATTNISYQETLTEGTNCSKTTINALITELSSKADLATTLAGYGITDAYTITEIDNLLSNKADAATTLAGYGITDAYTSTEVDTLLSAKQDTLSFDATPTENSTNPVTSGGVYDAVSGLTGEVAWADLETTGSINVLPCNAESLRDSNTDGTWSGDAYTINGLTFTIQSDGTVDLTGSTSADAYLNLPVSLVDGLEYKASHGLSWTHHKINLLASDGSTTSAGSFKSGTVTFTKDSSNYDVGIYQIYITSGFAFSGTVVYPMITPSNYSGDYVPFAETNYNLTQNKAEKTTISDAYDSSTTYAVGEHFIYENTVYEVDVACTGVTPPNANYYTAYTITELIEANTSQISDLVTSLDEHINSIVYSSSTTSITKSVSSSHVYLWYSYGGGSVTSSSSAFGLCLFNRIYTIQSGSDVSASVSSNVLTLTTTSASVLKGIVQIA